MPAARALRLCPQATIVPVPRGAVGKWSRRVRAVLKDLAPVVQSASVDEFYLDLTGTERAFGGESLAETAERIRKAVRERAGIAVSIGGGTRRVIAKLATKRAKPDGVHVVEPGREEEFMRTLDLGDIPGIGPMLARKLAAKGLVSVESAWEIDRGWFERWFGERRGAWIHRRIRGLDDSAVVPRERRVSISSERTFGNDIDDDDELLVKLLTLCGGVGVTLRSKSLGARTITVKVRDFDFRTRQRNRTVSDPVESDSAIYRVAAELLGDLRQRRRVPARLLGVGLGGLADAAMAASQLDLFAQTSGGGATAGVSDRPGPVETTQDRDVTKLVDELGGRFGRTAVVRGSVLREGSRDRTTGPGSSDGSAP